MKAIVDSAPVRAGPSSPGVLQRAADLSHRWMAATVTTAGAIARAIAPPKSVSMGFVLSHRYQRPYIESLYSVARREPQLDCRCLETAGRGRYRLPLPQKLAGFDFVFHSRPFQTGAFLRRDICHVLVKHGPTSGYRDGLGSFAFGRGRLLGNRKRQIYGHIFVPFEWDKELAEREVPEYRGRIHVIGCKRLDRILANECRAAEIRASLGIATHEKCVVIASTHSGRSMLSMHLDGIVQLLEPETTGVKYQLVVHPYAQRASRGQFRRLQALCARHPDRLQIADQSRLEELLVAADLMISDHGSLSLYYAALNKPLAYVPLDTNLMPDSPLMTIQRSSFQLRDLRDAEPLVRSLRDGTLRSQLNPAHVQRLRSGRGGYDDLARRAIAALVSERACGSA